MTGRPPRPGYRLPNGAQPRRDHRCPGGCGQQVPNHLLACKPDWFRLPSHVRQLFSHGQGRLSDAQANALRAAVEWYADNPRTER